MLWVNIAAVLSGTFCLLVFVYSNHVSRQLKDLKKARGLSTWDSVMVIYNGSPKSAKRLILEFHAARIATIVALVMIVAGFIWSPTILEKTFADTFGVSSSLSSNSVKPITILSVGTILGWICSFSTLGYFKYIGRNLLGE